MEKVKDLLNNLVRDHKTPSVQYIVFDKDRELFRYKAGLADVKNNISTTDNTVYNGFSATKTFTALAVMQLMQDSKLDIDDPVINYLPDFQYSPKITIRQLLSHSAGIPNPIPLRWIHSVEEHSSFDRNGFFDPILKRKSKARSKPNNKFAYSNLGYVLLGQLIEKVSGQHYEDFIRTNIILPLGIDLSQLDFNIHKSSLRAKGYHRRNTFSYAILGIFFDKKRYIRGKERGWAAFKDMYVNGPSYGGLKGTAGSFTRYIQDLLQNESTLITSKYKNELFKENLTNDGKASGMGLSWFSGRIKGKQYFTHAGGGAGHYCEIRIYPEHNLGSVIMFNRSGMKDERFLDKVDEYFI